MIALIKKELRLFFSGSTAYLTGLIFFVVNAFVLFVLPTPFNIYQGGFASLEGFFAWIPLMFLFLIPALCMRSFSEEKKTGTLECLLTRPLKEWEVVGGKWLSCYAFMIVLLLPTFLYLLTIYNLASPTGNIDMGAFTGAFVGILLLGMVLVSIGVFMSACTRNQMIAFILSVLVSSIIYWGFGALAKLPLFGRFDLQIASLGIEQHYISLSRGVIDIRDIMYYISLAAIFFFGSLEVIRTRGKHTFKYRLYFLGALLLLNVGAALWAGRWDMTSDKRYTLLSYTKEYLKEHRQEPILVKIYLSGDLPAGFKKLEKTTKELLDEFRLYNPSLQYQFIDIYKSDEAKSTATVKELMEKGLEPTQLEIKTKEGMVRRLIFPCAEISANGNTVALNLLQPQMGRDAQTTLNHSAENLEIQLINFIRIVFDPPSEKIAFLDGHGEEAFANTLSIGKELSMFYTTQRLYFNDTSYNLSDYAALILARPEKEFSQSEKYLLDQYLMNGGKIIWLISPSNARMDSLRFKEQSLALLYPLNLDEIWFRYGFKVDRSMVLDLNACPTPVVTGYMGEQPIVDFMPNVYSPVLAPTDSVTGRGIDPLCGNFPAPIDTVENELIKKTPLLTTSLYSKTVALPHPISADLMRENLNRPDFNSGSKIIGWYLEGEFNSAFKAIRPTEAASRVGFKTKSKTTAMAVIGDGALIRNEIDNKTGNPLPCGYDKYTGRTYGNKDFFVNLVHRLCGNEEWTALKPRQIAWRVIDKGSLDENGTFWTILNICLPICYISLIGGLAFFIRRKRFK